MIQNNLTFTFHSDENPRPVDQALGLVLPQIEDWLSEVDAHCGLTHTQQDNVLDHIMKLAKKIRDQADVFIIVGVGGSNQGTKAVIDLLVRQSLQDDFMQAVSQVTGQFPKQILYMGTHCSADTYETALAAIHSAKHPHVHVIAKAAQTLEPTLGYRLAYQALVDRYGETVAAQHMSFCGTYGEGQLADLAEQMGSDFIEFPIFVGGRFSVFSAVGLLPLAVMGVDIQAFQSGARAMWQSEDDQLASIDQVAKTRRSLFDQGFVIEQFCTFNPTWDMFARWWRQLIGESEGKSRTGIYPAVACYTEDLHSIGQYIQDGRRQVVEWFLFAPDRTNLILRRLNIRDGHADLNDRSLDDINRIAYESTVLAHRMDGVPAHCIEIDHVNAYTVGYLMMFFILLSTRTCAYFDVNPYDQPGVEAYKQSMKKRLS